MGLMSAQKTFKKRKQHNRDVLKHYEYSVGYINQKTE